MADVLGRAVTAEKFRWVLAGAAVYKAIDVARVAPWFIAMPLGIAGITVLVMQRDRLLVGVAAAALLVDITPAYWNHLVLLMWACLAAALFANPGQRAFVLRSQLSIMYGYAALAKLWPDWLVGDVLLELSWLGPALPAWLLTVAIWSTIVVEAALAFGVWRTWRGWFWLVVGLHGSFVVFLRPEPTEIGRLLVFGIISLSMWMHADHLSEVTSRRPGDEAVVS